ncbi:MAG TPA: glycosyltransferase family 39 protein [Chloroflexia bacterium]|nr:glycosyltransferase family 39 protein [Chloroflexia bacterium]
MVLGTRILSIAAVCALSMALLAAILDFPNRWAYVEARLPLTQLWAQPDEQNRIQSSPAPYDLLKEANAALPRHAPVLLVTPGRDIAYREYNTFHRALYFLTPRPVWWMAPTHPDGSWKSRWWISTPVTPDSIRSIAAEKGAQYILAYGLEDTALPGSAILKVDGGVLVRLGEDPPATQSEHLPASSSLSLIWPLQLIAGALIVWLLGNSMLTMASRLGYSASGVEAVALSWSLGAGLLSVLMLWLSALGIHLDWQIAILTLLAAGLGTWHMTTNRRAVRTSPVLSRTKPGVSWPTTLRWLLLALIIIQVALVILMAVGRPLEVWDSWVTWTMKARAIFLDGYISPAVYADPSRAVTQLDYPLLVPLVQAWFFGWLGTPDDRLVGVPSVLFYLSLIAVCYAAVRARGGEQTLALLAATVVATMSLLAGLAGIVFAEMPLTLFTVITVVYLLKWLEGGPRGTLLVASLGAGLMLWTKKEGALLLATLCVAALATNLRRRRAWLGVGWMGLGAALIAGPWLAFTVLNGTVNSAFLPVTLDTFRANIGRVPTIAQLELNSLLNGWWSYIWPLAGIVALAALFAGKRPGLHADKLIPLAALLYIPLAGLAYVFSDFVPYEQHVLSSIDRLLVPLSPLLVLWLAFQVGTPLLRPPSDLLSTHNEGPTSGSVPTREVGGRGYAVEDDMEN